MREERKGKEECVRERERGEGKMGGGAGADVGELGWRRGMDGIEGESSVTDGDRSVGGGSEQQSPGVRGFGGKERIRQGKGEERRKAYETFLQ